MTRFARFALGCFAILIIVSIPTAYVLGAGSVHPPRREFTSSLANQAKQDLAQISAATVDIGVIASDGAHLKGWIATRNPGGDNRPPTNWVLLFHGQSDNRAGTGASRNS
jgi:hypothetical protein